MALQHKSKLRFYRELKREIGFVAYLEHVKGAPCRSVFKLHSGTHGLFEEMGRQDKVGGSQKCPNCGTCKESITNVLFNYTSYGFQRIIFFVNI